MTFDEMWKDLATKNPGPPHRAAPGRVPSGLFKRHLERAHEEGRRLGHAQADSGEQLDGSRRPPNSLFGSIFGDDLFGGGR